MNTILDRRTFFHLAALTSAGIPTYLVKRSATIADALREGLSLANGGLL